MKPKLVIVLGAGASEALKIPGTTAISNAVRTALRKDDGYPQMNGSDAADIADMKAQRPFRIEPLIDSIRRAGSSNFESDMNIIETLMSIAPLSDIDVIMNRSQYRDTEPRNEVGQFRFPSPISRIMRVKSVYEALQDREALENLLYSLISTVRSELSSAEEHLSAETTSHVAAYFEELSHQFDLVIYSLNYDTAADVAAERVFGAINDGFADPVDGVSVFSGRSFLDGDGTRFAHLHGSLRYKVRSGNGFDYEVVKVAAGATPHGLTDVAFSYTQARDFAVIGSIITGLRKADKTRTEPYGTYSFALERDLLESPYALLIGYGGSDTYLNLQLLRAAKYHGSAWRPGIVTLNFPRPGEGAFALSALFAGYRETPRFHLDLLRLAAGFGTIDRLVFDARGWQPNNNAMTRELVDALRR